MWYRLLTYINHKIKISFCGKYLLLHKMKIYFDFRHLGIDNKTTDFTIHNNVFQRIQIQNKCQR